ncbi:MAG: sn-glycerol-1-phosphate dehydrogenase [Thermomicrobiales bacterium]
MVSDSPARFDRAAIDDALDRASTTRHLVLESNVLPHVGSLIRQHLPGRTVLLICDEMTRSIAAETVRASIIASGISLAPDIVLTGMPQVAPDLANVAIIRRGIEAITSPVLPIAVGSGTINDLTKRAAHECAVPYAVIATAASMDGYTASGAALIADGVKQTFACAAPVLVIADRDILATAPSAMTASGYGDLLGKLTAGADWLIADALEIEPIVPTIWKSVQVPLRGLLDRPERYASGDANAIEDLFLALANSGLAIQATGSSRPASGSEHQFSHYWEMQGLEIAGRPVSHGFKVGIGSIVAATLYERLLERDLTTIDVPEVVHRRPSWSDLEATITSMHSRPAIRQKALDEMRLKYVSDDALATRLQLVRSSWVTLSDTLRHHLMPAHDIAQMLNAAGAPSHPADIGLTLDQIRLSYYAASHIRRRYTVFDLVHDLGLFDELLEELFNASGYWLTSVAISGGS